MSSLVWIILALGGAAWVLAIFTGYVSSMGKSFHKSPASVSQQSSHTRSEAQQAAENARLKHQEMMESMKQRISDGLRRN